MPDDPVRSLYESDAALRRAAQVLRPLSAEEAAARSDLAFPATAEPGRKEHATDDHALLQNALRRSRDVLDMLQRVIRRHTEQSR